MIVIPIHQVFPRSLNLHPSTHEFSEVGEHLFEVQV